MLKYLLITTAASQLILAATFSYAEPETKGCVWNNQVSRVGEILWIVGEDDRMYQLICVQRVEPEKLTTTSFKINASEYVWVLAPTLKQKSNS